jgi:aspartate/methionine/tyrosine aminotransferase
LDQGVKAVLIASPANPTGALIPPDLLQWLASLPVPLISDEIYHGLIYADEPAHTALEFSGDVIVVNGLSKRLAMTGLRIGWAIVPPELVRPFQKLNQNLFICADSISQQAAIPALTDPSCEEEVRVMVKTYDRRRKALIDGLRRIGFKLDYEPRGAFYVFADIAEYSDDGYRFAYRLLKEAKVAATPGIDFGKNETNHFLRFAYTIDEARIEEGISRIAKWLGV